MSKSPTIEGEFLETAFSGKYQPVSKHLSDFVTNEETPPEMVYIHDHKPGTDTNIPLYGMAGTASPKGGSVVVLDVGRWGGGKTGAQKIDGGWPVQRDFGISYGNVVCLCSFEKAKANNDSASNWEDKRDDVVKLTSKTKGDDSTSVLQKVFKSLDDKAGLGKVIVRRYIVADGNDYDLTCVYVYTGDMHLGVVQTESHAHKNGARMGRCTVSALEATIGQAIGPNATLADTKAWLKDLGTKAAEAMIKNALWHVVDPTGLWKQLYGAASGTDLQSILTKAHQDVRDNHMDADEEKKWWQYYSSPAPGAKPADIFQSAGEDYYNFVSGLVAVGDLGSIQVAVPGSKELVEQKIKLQYVQMGDMFDLWVGFSCYYTPATTPPGDRSGNFDAVHPFFSANEGWGFSYADKVVTDHVASKMASEWGDQIMRVQTHVAKAVDALQKMDPPAVFLYGNHDNYYGRAAQTGPGTFKRHGKFEASGIYGEHGHQWPNPNSNSDNTPLSTWAQLFVGTPSPFGNFVTQVAFIRPQAARNAEGAALGVLALKDGEPYGQRLQQIGAACDLYVRSGAKFGIYVLAHTHVGSLAKVRIRPADADPVTRAKLWMQQQTQGAIDVTSPNEVASELLSFIGANTYRSDAKNPGPVDIKVSWKNVIVGNEARVALVDPSSENEISADFWVYTDKTSESGRTADIPGVIGSHTFKNVPPGMYEARIYLMKKTRTPWLKKKFAIVGVSATVTDKDDDGMPTFKFADRDSSPVKPPIFVRWAGIPTWKLLYSVKPWAGMTKDARYVPFSGAYVYLTTDGTDKAPPAVGGRSKLEKLAEKGMSSGEYLVVYLRDGKSQADWGDEWARCKLVIDR